MSGELERVADLCIRIRLGPSISDQVLILAEALHAERAAEHVRCMDVMLNMIASEREACAQIAEEARKDEEAKDDWSGGITASRIAAAIRARRDA